MKKLFRFHRGSLAESLDTTIEVSGFAEVLEKVMETYGDSISNIKIKKEAYTTHACPRIGTSYASML